MKSKKRLQRKTQKENLALRFRNAQLAAENEEMKADIAAAASVFFVNMADAVPGSTIARLLVANRVLKTEHREYVADLENSFKHIMAEDCPSDEVHCTCVPALRVKVKELQGDNAELRAKIDRVSERAVEMLQGSTCEDHNNEIGSMSFGKFLKWSDFCPYCARDGFKEQKRLNAELRGIPSAGIANGQV